MAFPEFVAQISSYRQSPQRRRDLHLLVDVGAGTVDIVTFHVWEPEETDCYSILEAAVEKLGTHMLLGYRAFQETDEGRMPGPIGRAGRGLERG